MSTSQDSTDQDPADAGNFTRRTLLGTAGAGLLVGAGVGVAGAGVAYAGAGGNERPVAGVLGSTRLPFRGDHQSGITDPPQARVQLAAFDLAANAGRDGLRNLLQRWTWTAERLTAGQPAEESDNQISLDLGPCSLTLTVGFGATLFDKAGLADRRPAGLEPLPAFPGDALDQARGDGDLIVQICADDALVTVHALRVLQRLAVGTATLRWQAAGFSRTPGAASRQVTPRNLMGQVDGTNNPRPGDDNFNKVFYGGGSNDPQPWLGGGSFLVFRRIRMLLDNWEALPVDRQERVIGRRKSTGSPLSAAADAGERTRVDLAAQNSDGSLKIPADAHIRVAAPASNSGAAMLRRSFSYHDGLLSDGSPDAGLLFLAYQADPREGFVPVQRNLSRADSLSRFLRHEASGLYAIPPSAPLGGYLGQQLFEAH
ncbi:iron uptake transporter deferrochelatase/peroxidase subunit [Kitasatospora sp. NPDC056651]|uniref:iron uptake transporter deferrochelatase/peroxidase subunit n=1 Tax=Kitasatospora sp. NPDC056651 TaxID=3345892 RepID=UPI003684645B